MIDQIYIGQQATATHNMPRPQLHPSTTQLHIAQVVRSAPVQTRTKTGQKFQILLSVGEYKTESRKETTVSANNEFEIHLPFDRLV